jgi:hypothetical protein
MLTPGWEAIASITVVDVSSSIVWCETMVTGTGERCVFVMLPKAVITTSGSVQQETVLKEKFIVVTPLMVIFFVIVAQLNNLASTV